MPSRHNTADEDEVQGGMGSTRRPDPDPTARTLVLVDKAISSLREELKIQFDAVERRFTGFDRATQLVHDDYVRVPTVVDKAVGSLRELLESRILAQENLLMLMRENIAIRPDQIAKAVSHLETLMDQKIATSDERLLGRIDRHVGETEEKFAGVNAQFSERDTRTDQRAGDTKLAVDAAFAAAKEATSKIELGFTKQIDSMVLAMDTLAKNLDSKISDVKDMINDVKGRLTAVEGRAVVTREMTDMTYGRQKDFTGWIIAGAMFLVALVSVAVTIVRHV